MFPYQVGQLIISTNLTLQFPQDHEQRETHSHVASYADEEGQASLATLRENVD